MSSDQATAELKPLRSKRGLRILQVDLVLESGEVETFDFAQSALTVITGPRNSSKTTTLKVIDYCLGDNDSPRRALGPAIEERYQAVGIDIVIDGVRHRLTRQFSHDMRTKVVVDGETVPATEVSDWLLQRLGWPSVNLPQGGNPLATRQQTSLSFRGLLRHIYRREDSWTEFAHREEELLRRAAVSLFLGFAPQRYASADYALEQAARALAVAQAVHREAVDSRQITIRTLTQQLNLPSISDLESLDAARTELSAELITAIALRDRITAAAEAAARQADTEVGVDHTLPRQLGRTSERVARGAVSEGYEEAEAGRVRLAAELQDRRVHALAPFMAALEDSAADIGRLMLQLAAIPALETILAREDVARRAVEEAERECGRQRDVADTQAGWASDAGRYCSAFADSMNEFLEEFDGRVWVRGRRVTIASGDLTFYVGTRPWYESLGPEACVLFFLAHTYALVRLSATRDPRTCAPGVLILDNPHQQGLATELVHDAIRLIGRAAEESEAQVVITQVRSSENLTLPHTEIKMSRVYDD